MSTNLTKRAGLLVMKRLKVLAGAMTVAMALGVSGVNAFAAVAPASGSSLSSVSRMNSAMSSLSTEHVSSHETDYFMHGKNVLDVNQVSNSSYVVTNNKNQTFDITVTPSIEKGVSGYGISITSNGKVFLRTFSQHKINFQSPGPNASFNSVDAAVLLIATGDWQGATGSVLVALQAMKNAGWFTAVQQWLSEGESIWAIAAILVSSLPDLGVIGIVAVA